MQEHLFDTVLSGEPFYRSIEAERKDVRATLVFYGRRARIVGWIRPDLAGQYIHQASRRDWHVPIPLLFSAW